ncbi:unnamed protein product, partial [Coregonus sp. 'balchen']
MEDPTVMEEWVEDLAITASISSDSVTSEPSLANKDGVEDQSVTMTGKDASLTSVAMASSTDAITNTEVNLAMASSTHSEANLGIALSTDDITNKEASGTIALPMYSKANTDAKPAIPPIASASSSPAATMTNSDAKLALPSPFSSPAASGPAPGGLQPEEGGLSAVRSCGSVGVTLENSSVWKEFHRCGTEMILTKQGRRMFPYCRYRLTGLEPTRRYALVLSITPVDTFRHRWNLEWEPSGLGEPLTQASRRVFPHQDSSALGKVWMASLVSFYKLKLTNHCLDQEGHVLLHSMHRYRPSLHVIPIAEGDDLGFDPKLLYLQLLSPDVMTFTFPQTEFYAVTSYQNTRITQLKIDYNPFAKGFREDSGSPRLAKPRPEQSQAGKGDTRSPGLSSARPDGEPMESEVPSSKKVTLVEPTMTSPILVPEPQEGKAASLTPKTSELQKISPKPFPPTPSPSTPTASPFAVPKPWKKGRKSGGNRWGNVGKVTKGTKVAIAAVAATSSPVTVAMQPQLDDVEGLLFVSFTSKEALGVHVEDMPPSNTSPVMQEHPEKTVVESDEEEKACLQTILLQDLNTPKHRQLSSLDSGLAIDLQYLGVKGLVVDLKLGLCLSLMTLLPLCADGSRSFVSRTGKTSDLTKIKGWREKFIRTRESSQNHNPNRSAFCSDMLNQYLESQAQRIRAYAAAFSHNPLGSVAYQLPVTSTSYVRTLDSVLKTRALPPQPPAFCRPCPLSRKPLLYAALKEPPPPINDHMTPPKAAKPKPKHAPPQGKQHHITPPQDKQHHITPAQGKQHHITPAQGKQHHITPAQGKQHHITPAQGKGRSASLLRPIQVSNSNKTTAAKAIAEVKVTSPTAQRSPPGKGAVRRDTSPGGSLSSGLSGLSKNQLRLVGLSKIQLKMMEMEDATFYQGHDRTHITTERVETALRALLTAQGLPKSSAPKSSQVDGPECGSEFCRLGCVCSSLARVSRGPLHCYRPDCMLGCSCFKRKISKQTTAAENDQNQMLPVYTMSNVDHEIQPNRGIRVSTLWDLTSGLREEDKDPVYKYYESMMTCAGIREFNSKPCPQVLPPQVHLFNDSNSFIIPSSGK